MIKSKYPFYALAIVAVGGIAFWAGLPSSLLIVLLVCPLMMLLMMSMMMRGPNSGRRTAAAQTVPEPRGFPIRTRTRARLASRPWTPDGSHDRM